MENASDFPIRRGEPGVIILSMEGALLYLNAKALELFPELKGASDAKSLPSEVMDLHAKIREKIAGGKSPSHKELIVAETGEGTPCSVMAIMMGQGDRSTSPTHVMLLVEKMAPSQSAGDLDEAQSRFNLTKREAAVLACVCQGLSNKEISEKLFISEHTAKDHLKNIMRKMEVRSRGRLIALVSTMSHSSSADGGNL